jgi:hypothetical protein
MYSGLLNTEIVYSFFLNIEVSMYNRLLNTEALYIGLLNNKVK